MFPMPEQANHDGDTFGHEHVQITRGPRSGLPVIVAVHSTALGPAIGGCRLWRYTHWREGLTDAMRLAAGMTDKAALAGLGHGGGKTVVALPPGATLDRHQRRAVMHDVGDLVDSLAGTYATGPDVDTGPADMATIAQRTPHVFCRDIEHGGSGDSSPHTAAGVMSALRATCAHLFGSPELAGRRIAVIGCGHVGSLLAKELASAGAQQTLADIDPTKRVLADEFGATWANPQEALTTPMDIVVPAALGGVITHDVLPRLACTAIAGPANNQLTDDTLAHELHQRGILWAPDYLVSAGGIIYATALELHRHTHEQALARVTRIGNTLAEILTTARRHGTSPHHVALHTARQRVRPGTVATGKTPSHTSSA